MRPADHHHHRLAEAIDEPAQDEALQPDRGPAQQVAQGEPEQAEGDGVARADPGRQPHPREHAVEEPDPVADLLPGHVVLVDVEGLPHGVVGEDGLHESLVDREEDEEDRQGRQPVASFEPQRRGGRCKCRLGDRG